MVYGWCLKVSGTYLELVWVVDSVLNILPHSGQVSSSQDSSSLDRSIQDRSSQDRTSQVRTC